MPLILMEFNDMIAVGKKLQELSTLIGARGDSGHGRVFIDEEADTPQVVYKVDYEVGANNWADSIINAVKLAEKLQEGALIEKGRVPDSRVVYDHLYEHSHYSIGNNVIISVDPGDNIVQLAFTSSRPVEKIMESLEVVIESRKDEINAQKEEHKSWVRRVAQDQERELAATFSSVSRSSQIDKVTRYIIDRAQEAIPHSNPTVEYTNDSYDHRSRFSVQLYHRPGEGLAEYNDFARALGEVFDGKDAVNMQAGGSVRSSGITINISGSAARLLMDIERNDQEHLPSGKSVRGRF